VKFVKLKDRNVIFKVAARVNVAAYTTAVQQMEQLLRQMT